MKLRRWIVFGLVGALSLFLLWFFFEFRYAWYVSREIARLNDAFISVIIVMISVCWALFPSRVAVGLLGATAYLIPPLYIPTSAGVTGEFAPVVVVVTALLILATHLRRGLTFRNGGKIGA